MASRRLVGAVGVALLGLSFAACQATPPSPSTASQPSTLSTDACAAAIRAADLGTPETIDAVDHCRFTTAGADAASAVLGTSPTGGPRWAALWVYAASGSDPAPLRPYLTSDDPSSRAMAAAALVVFGDRAGFDVLAAAIGDVQTLAGTTPPMSIDAFATASLGSSIRGAGLPTAATAWPAWLAANQAALAYDESTATWALP